ncbi:MAG: autotransporter domain-containing protein [Prosthecobacter sp.]
MLHLSRPRSLLFIALLLVVAPSAFSQDTTLISNFGQPNLGSNSNFSNLDRRVAWDFTTGASAFDLTALTVQASNDDGRLHSFAAQFFTSAAGTPESLVGTLTLDVTFTEGTFQDFTSNAGTVRLDANTTYWIVASLIEEPDSPEPGLRFRRVDSVVDPGGEYSSNPLTPLLTSTDGGATWAPVNGADAAKYRLEGILAAVATVPPGAVITAESLQHTALNCTTALLGDFALRLYRARSGVTGGDPNSQVVNVGGEDSLLVMGEGDGPEREVGFHTGGAGEVRIFSAFDYGYGDISTQNASQRTDTYAGSLGAEMNLTSHLSVGGGLGALNARTRLPGDLANVDTEGLSLVGYLSHHRQSIYLDLLYAATLLDHDLTRNTGAGTVTASPDSTVHTVQFNVGHNFTHGQIIHGPFLSLNYAHASTDPYSESGAGAVSVGRQQSDTLVGRIGWQASAQFQRDWGMIIPQVRLSWDKQYLNDASAADVALAGVPGVVTRTSTGGVEQDGLGVGAGVMLRLNNHWSVAVNYQGHVFDKAANMHNATVFVSYRW